MNANYFVAVATAALAIGFLWESGCSSSSSGDNCAVGSESCPCTAGGSCDKGLTCLSNRCVNLDGGSTTTIGAGGANTGSTTSSTTGSGGNVTGSGGAAGGGARGTLGSACTSTANCQTGLTCLTPNDDLATGAGVPNGICTLDCTSNPGTACAPYNGSCVSFEAGALAKGFCMENCTQGVAASAANMKCHLRQDFACATLGGGAVCVPICTDDAECGSRKCNPGTGLCEAQRMAGAPLGASCTVDSDCAGFFCLSFNTPPADGGPAPGACSEFCRFGNTTSGCEFRITSLDAGPPVGACLYTSTSGNFGDLGACGQLCDVPADCLATFPGWTCVQNATIKSTFHHGYCGFDPDAGP
jgi:hypothetical protein